MSRVRLPRWTVMSATGWLVWGTCISFLSTPLAPAAAADVQTNRMKVEYVPPTNPAHQALYDRIKERHALEKLQEIFSPLRLPVDLTIRTMGCDGFSNAWYGKKDPSVNVCYEYLNEIMQTMPKETTADGITSTDAVMGQFFYVMAHEMGHAMFDILAVPVSDAHAAPAQRFYNLLCLAYGADPALFGDVVKKGYLPEGRARGCKGEYEQVTFAFRDLIVPHLDQQLAKTVLDKTWLPDVKAEGSAGRALQ
jgi:hypothetical protein